ncbi:hypothetical protein CSOJ01_07099 [Colletotrichum sojae]|uniref:Uncharacterized protein n=1 Tax=Colletotrichum sojae TaxID=2175907 RepID=A0A8H6J9T5_9PEZI|nr:hypothetical protein CSOJ01_07099 [Colletotrichum sojae]
MEDRTMGRRGAKIILARPRRRRVHLDYRRGSIINMERAKILSSVQDSPSRPRRTWFSVGSPRCRFDLTDKTAGRVVEMQDGKKQDAAANGRPPTKPENGGDLVGTGGQRRR